MSSFQLSLPEGYTYLYETSVGEGRLKIRLAEVRDEDSARAWLEELQTISNVTWRVSRTYPHAGRVNLFQVRMRCQHNTDTRAQHNKRSHKHTGCPASLCITVKRNVKYSRSQNAAKNSTYPTIVVMDGRHNHSISDADVLKFRDMGTNTKQTLLDLFHHGHSASSALLCIKTDLMLEHGDEFIYVYLDGRYMPSLSRVQKLFDKFKRDSGDDVLSDVNRLLQDYCEKDNGGTAKFGRVGDHCFVAICSPLMGRAHRKLPQASEVVMVDDAGGLCKQKARVYVFACQTAAGGIPLGVIVSSGERKDVFEAAVASLKTCFPEGSFYGSDCPKAFLMTSNLKEQRVLEKQFPGSTILLCEFHVLNAFWSWLLDASNGISDNSDRQILYLQFRTLVYAVDTEILESLHNSIVASPLYAKYPKLWAYLASMWDLRTDWAQCYRKNLPMHASKTTNYTDFIFRVVNKNIFNRTRMFSLSQLVDFILRRYEAYMVQRLLDFCHGRYTNSLFRYMLLGLGGYLAADGSELLAEVGMFHVRSRHPDELCTVDIVRRFCSCGVVNAGRLCRHMYSVLLLLDLRIGSAYNFVSADTKSQLFEVAHASVVQTESLMDLHDHPSQPASLPSSAVPSPSSATGASFYQPSQPSADEETNIQLQLTAEEERRLQKMVDRLLAGLVLNQSVFVPAVRNMLENIDHYAATETGLANAISTFGEPVALRQCSSAKKRVRPTSTRCKKVCLTDGR